MKRYFATSVLLICFIASASGISISWSASPKPSPTPSKGAASSKVPVTTASKKPTVKATPTKSSLVSKTTATKTSFSQVPWQIKPTPSSSFFKQTKKSPADLDIDSNKIKTEQTTKINIFGEVFKLPEVASASQIVTLLQKELACTLILDPKEITIFPLFGSIKEDTLAMCKDRDPAEEGFIFYVTTSKEALALFNSSKRPQIKTPYENTYTYSSLKAVIMVAGGPYAFDAEEISYDILSVLGYEPERVKLS